jgi:transcriptional regulator with XRE-family HTH domain
MSYLRELDKKMRDADPEYDRIRAVDSFIEELVKARKDHGLTQAQVAEAAGIRQSHVSRIENYESERVAFDTILRYAHAIGLDFKLVNIAGSKAS